MTARFNNRMLHYSSLTTGGKMTKKITANRDLILSIYSKEKSAPKQNDNPAIKLTKGMAKKVALCCGTIERQRRRHDRLVSKVKKLRRHFDSLNETADKTYGSAVVAIGALEHKQIISLLLFFQKYFFEIQEIAPDAQKVRELEKLLKKFEP